MSEVLRMFFKPNAISELNGIRQLLLMTLGASGAGAAYLQYWKYSQTKVERLAKNKIIDKLSIKNFQGEDGLILSNEIQFKEKIDFEHVAIIGPTGSGKTASYFFPNLLDNKLKGSYVIFDVKGELYEKTSAFQKNVCGRKVYKLSPLSPSQSEKYNLLENCKTSEEVVELASVLLANGALYFKLQSGSVSGGDDAAWLNMAKPLLSAAMIYAKSKEKPFNTIEYAIQCLLTLDDEILENLILNSDCIDAITQYNIYKTVLASGNTTGSIKITLASNMQIFTNDSINTVNSDSTFSFEKFREEPSILYITYPAHKANYISPYISALTSKMFNTFIETDNGKNLPIHTFADEVANLGLIPNMSNLMSTIRSSRISFIAGLQSITQLYQIYGKENSKGILNNMKTKIILPGLSDLDTLDYISKLAGNKEITVKSISINNTNASNTLSKQKISLFEDSDVRCLDDYEAILLLSNKMPLLLHQDRYYENEKYFNNIGIPVKTNCSNSSNNYRKKNINNDLELIKEDYLRVKAEKKKLKNKAKSENKKSAADKLAAILNDDNTDIGEKLRGN